MELNTITGDLLKLRDQFDYIVHGCNCEGIMGAGIALQVKRTWPHAYKDYTRHLSHISLGNQFQSGCSWDKISNLSEMLGSICISDIPDSECKVVHMMTQVYTGGPTSNDSALLRLMAIKVGFAELNRVCPNSNVGIPLIGAGLAGGNWDLISRAIMSVTPDLNITVVKYEPNK